MRGSLMPCCMIETTTTMVARKTLRPRKRSEGGVARERPPSTAQQKLKLQMVLCAQPSQLRSRLARIAGRMQDAAAGASCLACVVGKIAIVGQQQIVEGGVGQQG